jgi:pSer/pThr/pTyr-binding forkhead associated (FHA) protein
VIDDLDRHATYDVEDGTAPEPEPEPKATAPAPFAKIILKRNGAVSEIEFPVVSPAVIGRFDPEKGPIEIDLGPLPEAVYISRKHARLEQDEAGVWTITDLGSSNGTFVLREDFERVDSAVLEDGTEFALGNVRFVFHTA